MSASSRTGTDTDTSTLRDIVFAERPGFRPLSLDLHLPKRHTPPVVLYLHGGGWRVGSRRQMTPGRTAAETFGRITAHGWAVASVDYRLSGEARFPAQLEDVMSALDWLTGPGREAHGLDVTRICAWGESAGGHLAALAGLQPNTPVAAVIDWYGPSDFLTLLPSTPDAVEPSREEALLGHTVIADPERARAASPAHRVRSGAPPFLLAHGLDDTMIPPEQSRALARQLAAHGVPVELQLVPGADHMWRGLADLDEVFGPALAFLDRHVPGSPPARASAAR